MSKEKDRTILVEGIIVETLPSTKFRVKIMESEIIEGYISGKMRMHYIKLLLGDRVTVELSPYDLTRGRIVIRHKKRS